MDKKTFFLAAMTAERYKDKAWVISAFSMIDEEPDAWKKDPYAYRIVTQDNGKYFFVHPETKLLERLDDAVAKQPLFFFKEKVIVTNADIPNLSLRQTQTQTTYGNILFNYMVLIYAFGDKIGYWTDKVNTKQIEQIITYRLEDTPKNPEDRKLVGPSGTTFDVPIYVDELLKYGEAMSALSGFSSLCVPAASQKTITVNKDIIKRRDELVEANRDQLHDPAIVAAIEKELTDMYLLDLKGDPAEGFFVKEKTARVAMKKTFIMHGAETGFGLSEGKDVDTVTTSLSEGWDIEKIPQYVDNLRSGSVSRGSQTELGGTEVKGLHRVFQNTRVEEKDCGVAHGLPWLISEFNTEDLAGRYMVSANGKIELLTSDYLKSNIGKTIEVRSPMLCKTKAPSFCSVCLGETYGANPTGLGVSAAKVGSQFMSVFMAAMHSKALVTVPLRLKESIT